MKMLKSNWYLSIIPIVIVVSWFIASKSSSVIHKEVIQDSCLVVQLDTISGNMLSRKFETFFAKLEGERKQRDFKHDVVLYNVEPTQENKRYTEIEAGFVTSQKIKGFQTKEICLKDYLSLTKSNNAGIYIDLEKYADELTLELDKNKVIEISTDSTMTLMMKIKKGL